MAETRKPFHETVAERLIEQLRAGTAPWQRPWMPGEPGGILPLNPSTGKRYKGINAIHLMSQGRSDNRWLTYRQAVGAGAQVRKGERGTPVQYWKFSEEQAQRDEHGRPVLDAEGQPVKLSVKLERPRVFFATVFNAEQIDGLPPLARPPQSWDALERAEAILQASGAVIRHGEHDGAFYRLSTDSIHLPDRGRFASAANYYATALHELGHWTGHPLRLDRELTHPFGSEGYAKEELRAEIASMIVGDELGIGHDPGQHVAYVAAWIKALEDDPLEVFRAAAEAEKIKDYVLAFALQQVEEQLAEQVERRAQRQGPQPQVEQRAPHEMTLAEFAARAAVEPLTDHGRRWNVTLGERYAAFSDAPDAEAALADVHRAAVGNALLSLAPEASDTGRAPALPPPAVLAESPDLLPALLPEPVPDPLPRQVTSDLPDDEQEAMMQSPALPPTTDADAGPDAVPGAEAWVLRQLEHGTIVDVLETARLAQLERVAEVLAAMQPLNTDNAFWARHMLPDDVDALEGRLLAVIEPLGQLRDEARVARALEAGDLQALDAAASKAFDLPGEAPLPHDWNGVVQVQASAGHAREGAFQGDAAAQLDDTPGFWRVYAQCADGRLARVKDCDDPAEARHLAYRLAVVAANATDNEHERAARLARAHEDRVRHDPASTEDDVAAAKESRQTAEAKLLLSEAESEQRSAGQAAQAKPAADSPAPAERTYLEVPYREKDAAKALGARWDRRQQAWYVPPGVDTAPFARWAQGSTAARTAGTPDPAEASILAKGDGAARIYLAVPYGERGAAKAAGAAWDRVAKSWYAGPKADLARLQRWLPENVAAQQAPAMNPREEFAEALRAVGANVSGEHPIMDGRTHRIEVEGDRKGEHAGFYVVHLDGHPAGYIKNNRTGVEMTWRSKGYALDPREKAKLSAEAAAKLAARAREQERLHEASAQRVVKQLAGLVPVVEPTPYLRDKGIRVHGGVFTDGEGRKTYLPAFDADGKQWTLQTIHEDGTKRFARDSRKEGCFHVVGGMEALVRAPALVISEGYATAATNAEALGFATVAAFDAGNLRAVALALHEKFPDKPVLVLGDDDRQLELTQGVNAGRVKAEEAAKAVGGKALFPIFAPGENAYPGELPPLTPQHYRAHLRAVSALEEARKHPEGAKLTEEQTMALERARLSEAQLAALDTMKAHTDFNDLATRSALGREGLERQVKAGVGRVIREAEETREHVQAQKRQQVQALRPRRVVRTA